MRKRVAEQQIVVRGIPQRCFDALVDFESYPSWQSSVTACDVISRDREGRGRRVRFQLDAKVRPVSYTVEYSYEQPHLIAWKLIEGDVDDLDGELVLEDRGDGTTLATCALRIDGGAWLPGNAASAVSEQVTQSSLEGLKSRVESGA